MIERAGHSAFRLVCDGCELEPPNVGFLSFREAVGWARENNWHTHRDKQDGWWEHYCPECAKELGFTPPDIVPMEPVKRPEPRKARWVDPSKQDY